MKRILEWSEHNELQEKNDLIKLVEENFRIYDSETSTDIKNAVHWDDERKGIVINGSASLNLSSQIHLSIFKLARIEGNFSLFFQQFTSLEGCPKEIAGTFNCSDNKLTSLKGSPKPDVIRTGFNYLNGEAIRPLYCSDNILTNLEYSENYNAIECSKNNITSLNGCSKNVYHIKCENNKLTSLEGGPEETFKISCKENPLITLKGAPKIIHDYFECDDFKIYGRKWNVSGWIETMGETSENGVNLLLTLLTEDQLDDYFLSDPIKIYILDGAPKIKEGVLKRTGIKDFSRLGRATKTGLL